MPKPENRYELADNLERDATKLQSRLRGHFVDDHSLCVSCRWGHVYRQSSKNRRNVYCTTLSKYMPDDVSECSEYQTINQLTLHQMAEIATLIEVNEKKVGFHQEECP